MTKLSYLQAVSAALREEMLRDECVFIMGEDVAFNFTGTTQGFLEEFGPERIRNTPIAEAGFVGAAAGAAMVGMRPVVDMMMSSFFYVAFDQIVSIIAKSTYLYGGQCRMPVTLRAGMYYGNGLAAQHSDRPLSVLATVPGLKVIAPSRPSDAKGLLKAAIRDDDPVISLEDNGVWRLSEEVSDDPDYLVPLGRASVRREGSDVTIVAIARAVEDALAAADRLAGEGISAEVIDPRTVVPLDMGTILGSVKKTGRLVAVDPSHSFCSIASEIAATVAERSFWHLQGPVQRVATPHIHIPFSPPLENNDLYPNPDRIIAAVRNTMA